VDEMVGRKRAVILSTKPEAKRSCDPE